ncbi:alpha/beta hydrolase family protein [Telmatobacter bradus]|uniref:alpha/beta hydrolase family protein n=1 Tax=Telmatobacter bradus TaxID=474953 RepID=UPI003B43C794
MTLVPAFVSSAAAQNADSSIPASDVRNTQIVTTNTRQPLPSFQSLYAWQKRSAALRNQILVSTGLSPLPPKNDLHAQVFGKIEGQGYTIEKVLLETFPGFYLGGNLYRPVNGHAKHPGIVSPHGHWSYGRLENQPVFSGPSLGISLARQGYVVFAYDMVGYTDTLQIPHRFGSAEMRLWGLGPLGLQLWNSIRAVDFVTSLPDVDANDIGATGASGGASQTFLLAAVDERIHFSAPVNMISSFKQGGDLCENQAGLRIGTNNVELAAISAPRPMLMVSDTKDWTRNTLRDEYPAIHSIYALYGKPDAVEAVQIEAPHNFNRESREAVYRFFAKLHPGLSDAKDLVEHDISIPPLGDLMALYNHPLPADAVDLNGFFDTWRAMSTTQNAALHDDKLLRERLRQTLAVELPTHVDAAQEGNNLVLTRGNGDRLQAVRIKGNGKGPIEIVLDPEGSASALQSEAVAALRKQKRDVLVLDVFQTGSAKAPRDGEDHPAATEDPGNGGGPMFLTYNVSDDQARVQDVLTAIAYAQQLGRAVKIHSSGDAALWALFADAALDGFVERVAENVPELRNDEDYLKHFNVPEIERAGGVEVARQLSTKKLREQLHAQPLPCDWGCGK